MNLEKLSEEMNMSKSTLYRKIKSMTGLTPLDFVRNIKMKRACMMLLARTQTISEVAYAVGFSNPKYFTKCFKEEFGVDNRILWLPDCVRLFRGTAADHEKMRNRLFYDNQTGMEPVQ